MTGDEVLEVQRLDREAREARGCLAAIVVGTTLCGGIGSFGYPTRFPR